MAITPAEPYISAPTRAVAPLKLVPPLTEATIQRAREGLAAARDPRARAGVAASLAKGDLLVAGEPPQRVNPTVRHSLIRALVHALFTVRVEHSADIPTGPVMFAPNHLNHIDPFLMLAELPAHPFSYILGDARTLYNNAWKRTLIHADGGVIPLDRIWKEERAVLESSPASRPDLVELAAAIQRDVPDGGSLDALHRIDRIVQAIFARGDNMVIFPEGALGTCEGQLRPLKRGAVIYAMRAQVPIVPVGIIGTRDLYFRKELTVRFGPPLHFTGASTSKRATLDALAALQQGIQDLLPNEYLEPEGPKPLRHLLNHMFW